MKRPLTPKFLAAMIGLRPLPGAPCFDGDTDRVVTQALSDLKHYQAAGVDAVMIENGADLPYIKPPLPDEAVALVSHIAREVRSRFAGPVGIQLLEAANATALEVAATADLDFLRVEGFVFAHVGGAGIIEACAGPLLRLRKSLEAEDIRVFADVKKKHCAHALTADLTVADVARQAAFFHANGIIVTGAHTGDPAAPDDLNAVRMAVDLPLVIGSGVTPENLPRFFPLADGFIVGSTFRRDGAFLNPLEPQRLARFMEVLRALRHNTTP